MYTQKSIISIIFFSFCILIPSSLFAGGRAETAAQPEPIDLEALDLTEIRNQSLTYFSRIPEYFPRLLSVSMELQDTEENIIFEQDGEVRQSLSGEIIVQETTLVYPEIERGPAEGEGRGQEGGGQGGGPPSSGGGGPSSSGGGSSSSGGGPPSGEGDVPPEGESPAREEMTDEQIQQGKMLIKGGLELWDTSRNFFEAMDAGNLEMNSTAETLYIFDFPCVAYEIINQEGSESGLGWIDSRKGLPIKIILESNDENESRLDIYLLPSSEMGSRISSLYFSRKIVSIEGDTLLLNGSITPSDWEKM